MGRMVDGKWTTDWYEPDSEGRFVRPETVFRETFGAVYPPAAERYHLYVSAACPWSQRVMIMRAVKGLEKALPMSVVHPLMLEDGWTFETGFDRATGDLCGGRRLMREVYAAARADYTGRVTVPVVWDTQAGTIVNNESRDLMRSLDHAWNDLAERPAIDLCPPSLREAVDAAIDLIYDPVCNGVYRCGFATSQKAYDEAFGELFAALDHWDGVLAGQRFVCGDRLTEADVALYVTLVRFDAVYVAHFKTNLRRIADYPHLSGWLRDIHARPGFGDTTWFDHIRHHYFRSHRQLNPAGIVPGGPLLDLDVPHGRGHLPEQAWDAGDPLSR